ncbi:hypothetical protein HZH68_012511 [Vespula germanica]|uniref:G-protein coupled receptors family 1 profile domain-containing protein n=1 Tax=Vespula germanica TaxID=30212 RepID=A0A834JHT4_VESGE|nr:hypothetical protein HZH68_012511 [Vespula germanica]
MQPLENSFNSINNYSWNTSLLWFGNYTFDTSIYENDVNSTDLEKENQFILPWWRQMIWSLLFAGMIIVATGGNLIVIWIVLAHKRMRTVTNYFLVNLSIADAMVSTLNVTFNYIYMLNSHWPFGTLYSWVLSKYQATSGKAFTIPMGGPLLGRNRLRNRAS